MSVLRHVLRLLDIAAQRPHTHTDEPRGRSFTQPAPSKWLDYHRQAHKPIMYDVVFQVSNTQTLQR